MPGLLGGAPAGPLTAALRPAPGDPENLCRCSSTSRSRCRPTRLERRVEFWRLIGFERVDSPELLGDSIVWVEREGTQIHLIVTEGHTAPVLGHAAVVVPDHAEAKSRLRDAGFEVQDARQLWGADRAFATRPRRPPRRADGRAAAHPRVGGGGPSGLLLTSTSETMPLTTWGGPPSACRRRSRRRRTCPGSRSASTSWDSPPSMTVLSIGLLAPRTAARPESPWLQELLGVLDRLPVLQLRGQEVVPGAALVLEQRASDSPARQAVAGEDCTLTARHRAVGVGSSPSLVARDRELGQRGRALAVVVWEAT